MTYVRFWHLADINDLPMNVRYRGQSGHHPGKSGHQEMSIRGKADIKKCPLMSQSGHMTIRST